MMRRSLLVLAGVAAALAGPSQARVVRVVIEGRDPLPGDFGKAGSYELVRGRIDGEVDPKDPANALITDIALAPRNARGRVEYSATFQLAKPVDTRRASGVLFYDTPNRGNGRAMADPEGHLHLISGWQGDIPPAPDKQTATVPVARNRNGSPITGPIVVRFADMPTGATSLPILGGIGAGVPRPGAATLDTRQARLVRKRTDRDSGEVIPASEWAFADCRQAAFPGRAEPHTLCLRGGFDPAYAYELRYVAKDPAVLGLGFAAVRDLVAFLRYGRDDAATPNPVAGQVRWTIGTGVSQAGNFLRGFVHLGFNRAEDGRIVFDGVNPHIAARQVPLNLRFGVPGGAAGRYEPGSEGVLWWGRHHDRARGRGVTSLLARCTATNTCPKVMETFGSAEFWGLRMSPNLIGLEAKADIPLPTNVRRYYFPGVTHGGGGGGFDVVAPDGPRAPGCVLPGNPNPASDTMRALTRALVEWVTADRSPPPSVYPRLAAGDLVSPTRGAMGFPDIPGRPAPDGKLNPFLIQDFGPAFRADDLSGVMTIVPPRIVREAPSRVPRVDADGNETSGVASVQHRVPLGTYLGWNVQAAGYDKGAGCGFQGGFIPFARTRAEREAAGDPRPSLEERYGDHAGFVARVRAAATEQASQGFLLPADASRIVRQAEDSAVLR
jgi:hypothetical protein